VDRIDRKDIDMKQKLLSVLIGVTLVLLLLCLLRSKVVQALIGLWLLGGLAVFCCKMAESFLAGFRKGRERRAAHEPK